MFLINCIYCSSVNSFFSLQNQTSRIANHLRCRVQPVRAPTDRQAEQYDRFADPPAEEFARHGHSGHAGGVQKCRPTVRCDRYRHHRADLYSLRAYTGKCVGVWRLFLFLFCIVYVAVAIVVNQLPFSLLPEMRSHENDWFLVASGRWIFFSPVTPYGGAIQSCMRQTVVADESCVLCARHNCGTWLLWMQIHNYTKQSPIQYCSTVIRTI